MVGASALILAALSIAAGPKIFAAERRPIALLVSAPTGAAGKVSTSDLIRIASGALEQHTSLRPEVVEATLIAECTGRLSCIVPRLSAASDYVFALSNLTAESGPDVLTAIFADAREVTRCSSEADAEACVAERAVLGSARSRIEGQGEAESLVETLFREQLEQPLARAKIWEPFGELAILVRPRGASIFVDGAYAGVLGEEETTLVLAEGEHAIAFELADHQRRSDRIEVRARERATMSVVLDRERSATPEVMIAGGIAAAGIGAVIAVYALARADSSVADICLYPAGEAARCGSGSQFQRAGYDPQATPSLDDRLNPSGVLLAPLGYSLAIAGATWALSALVIDPRGEYAWLELIAGVAAGALAYSLSAVFEGSSALSP